MPSHLRTQAGPRRAAPRETSCAVTVADSIAQVAKIDKLLFDRVPADGEVLSVSRGTPSHAGSGEPVFAARQRRRRSPEGGSNDHTARAGHASRAKPAAPGRGNRPAGEATRSPAAGATLRASGARRSGRSHAGDGVPNTSRASGVAHPRAGGAGDRAGCGVARPARRRGSAECGPCCGSRRARRVRAGVDVNRRRGPVHTAGSLDGGKQVRLSRFAEATLLHPNI